MEKFFLKICIFLIINIIPLKSVYSDVFIVAKVNQEIITNIDVDFEKKYLVSLNPNLKKLDQNRITEYAKNSLINEKIKKIEIEKKFEIVTNEILLSKGVRTLSCGSLHSHSHLFQPVPLRLQAGLLNLVSSTVK